MSSRAGPVLIDATWAKLANRVLSRANSRTAQNDPYCVYKVA